MPAEEQPLLTRITGESDFATRECGSCCFLLWKRMCHSPEAGDEEDEKIKKRRWSASMMIREWSEIAAGPKWKTFIRRFGRNRFRMNDTDFRYDPMSYALNFDETAIQSSNCSEAEFWGGFSRRGMPLPAIPASFSRN